MTVRGKQGMTPRIAQLDWSDADAAPISVANVIWAQKLGTEVILTLGHAIPPAETSSLDADGMTRYLRENNVKATRIVRVLISEQTAKGLEKILGDL